MNVINLPPVLPGDLDLKALNLILQTEEVMLDWRNVKEAPEDHIAVLLAGMDLVEHSEILGIGTIPDELSDVVLRALSRSESKAPHLHEHKGLINKSLSPIVWEPEEKTDLDSVVPPLENVQQSLVVQPIVEAPRSFLQPPSPAALRDELEQLVLQDLLGPAGGPEEELDEGSVRDRYLVGMLAPEISKLCRKNWMSWRSLRRAALRTALTMTRRCKSQVSSPHPLA